MSDYESKNIFFGPKCSGGGADLDCGDTTISGFNTNLTINIHVHASDMTAIQKISRCIHGIFGRRIETIENAKGISQDELSGRIHGAVTNQRGIEFIGEGDPKRGGW